MKCSLCHHFPTIPLFSFPNPRPIGESLLSYRQCPHCQIVFLTPSFTSSQLRLIYSSPQYFTKLCQSTLKSFLDKLLQIRFFPEYDEYISAHFSSPSSVVDIGCGNGEFLLTMQKRGWLIAGIDPSPVAIANSRKTLGSKVSLKTSDIKPGVFKAKFAVATMWHVLEHIPNPRQFIRTVKSWLSPGALLVLEVPNSNSLIFRWFKSHYNWLMVPEHIFYYSAASLRFLLQSSGFRIIEVSFPPRAILNFSLSLYRLASPRLGRGLARTLFLLSLPLSVLAAAIATITGKTEVIRIVATHD